MILIKQFSSETRKSPQKWRNVGMRWKDGLARTITIEALLEHQQVTTGPFLAFHSCLIHRLVGKAKHILGEDLIDFFPNKCFKFKEFIIFV